MLLILINASVIVLGTISIGLMLPISCCFGRGRVFQNRMLKGGVLKRIAMFEHLPPDSIKKIARRLRLQRHAKAGTEIFAQGASADSLLIVASGTVSIVIDGVEKRRMRAPEVLGEKGWWGPAEASIGALRRRCAPLHASRCCP